MLCAMSRRIKHHWLVIKRFSLAQRPSLFIALLAMQVCANAVAGEKPAGMVWIPAGEFAMGCSEKCEGLCCMPGTTGDALPIHRVYVDGFWMDETEVTNTEFQKFADATGYKTV